MQSTRALLRNNKLIHRKRNRMFQGHRTYASRRTPPPPVFSFYGFVLFTPDLYLGKLFVETRWKTVIVIGSTGPPNI